MSEERVERLEKVNSKRKLEDDDIIKGKRTRLRCQNAKAEAQQTELDAQNQGNAKATASTEAQKKTDSPSLESAPAKIAYKEQPVLLKTIKPPPTESAKRTISGIATIGDETFLMCSTCSTVLVYAVATLDFLRQFKIRALCNVFDVASCPRNKCLYIMDLKTSGQSNEILKVDTNGKVKLRWSTDGGSFGGLSVTHESTIVFTDRVKGILKEFSDEGKLVLEVALPEDIRIDNPSHAVKLTNGHFVVCHGAHSDLLHRVCLVDNKGVVLKTIGEDPESFKWNYPLYMAVDSDESILVADNNNSRVVLLNSNLEFQRELLTEKDGLRHGWIRLDEMNGRLFVVDESFSGLEHQDCRLLVFDVKKTPAH